MIGAASQALTLVLTAVIDAWAELVNAIKLAFAVVSPPLSVDVVEKRVVMFAPWLFTVVCSVPIFVWSVVMLVPWLISVALRVATFENSVVMLVAAIEADVCREEIELFCVPSAALIPVIAAVLDATLEVSALILEPCELVRPCRVAIADPCEDASVCKSAIELDCVVSDDSSPVIVAACDCTVASRLDIDACMVVMVAMRSMLFAQIVPLEADKMMMDPLADLIEPRTVVSPSTAGSTSASTTSSII